MAFSTFDSAVRANDFWTLPIDDVRTRVAGAHDADAISNRGVTLVVGCPMPDSVADWVIGLRREAEQSLLNCGISVPRWREDLGALHITAYGLVRPDDYGENSWTEATEIVSRHLVGAVGDLCPFDLTLQGFGILGRGAIAARVSDSPELSRIRALASGLPGLSTPGFVEKLSLNQMIIGRLQPRLTDHDREALWSLCEASTEWSPISVAVDSLSAVHYQHEFLNATTDTTRVA